MSRRNGRQAVYLVTTAADFRPQRPWDLPPRILSAELHSKNLAMYQAQGFARVFNAKQLTASQRGSWDCKWAIVAKHIKARRHGRHPNAVKGGAA